MSRILVHDPRPMADGGRPLLDADEREVVRGDDPGALVSAFSEQRPHLLVYVLQDPARDIELLSAIRIFAPRLPLILLGEPVTLTTRRLIQELRPTYYGVFPLEGPELSNAVDAALGLECDGRRMSAGFRS